MHILSRTALFVLLISLIASCHDNKSLKINDVRLKRFSSCQELEKALVVEGTEKVPDVLLGGDFAAQPEAASDSPGSSDAVLGETNLQVAGVDELDHAKAAGDFIYSLKTAGYFFWGGGIGGDVSMAYPGMPCEGCESDPARIIVLRRSPSVSAGIIQEYDLTEPLWNGGLYVTDAKLILIGDTGTATMVYLFDRGGDGQITLAATREVEGSLQGSRMIGNRIHLILSKWLNPRYEDTESPPVEEELPVTLYDGNEAGIAECTDILFEPAALVKDVSDSSGDDVVSYPYVINDLVCALSIDLDNFDKVPKGECVAGNGWGTVIYASTDNLFLASTAWDTETPIHQFAFADIDGETHYIGTGLVHGNLLNQFSMDEYSGHLRVATTTWDFVEPEQTNEIRIFKLGDSDPEEVGAIEGMAPGERIYAVRFMEEKGFMVTFKQVDPLFALDLSDPENPSVRGELEVPGFSSYLHPMQEGYLLAVGKEGLDLAISIFDVRNLDAPALLDRLTLTGTYGVDSEALYDHKAFRYISDEGFVVLPVTVFNETDYDSGFRIFSASTVEGLAQVAESSYSTPEWSYTAAGRSFFNEGIIALLGGGELVLRSADDPTTELARVPAE